MSLTLDKFYSIILGYNILLYILYFSRLYYNFSNHINISMSSGNALRKIRRKEQYPSSRSSKKRRRWLQTDAPSRYKTLDVRCGLPFTHGYRITSTGSSTSTWIAARDYLLDIGLNGCQRNGDRTQPPGRSALPSEWCWGIWTERIIFLTWDWVAVTEMATEPSHLADTRCTVSDAERSEPNEWLWEMKVVAVVVTTHILNANSNPNVITGQTLQNMKTM